MKKSFLFLILINFSILFAENYIVAAQKFEYTKGQKKNSITSATAELVPQSILNNLGSSLMHSIYPDEELERIRNRLNKERTSLYLQLNAEYKRRDAIFLENYSQAELEKKLLEEDVKLQEIQDKIDKIREEIVTAEKERDLKNEKIANKALKEKKPADETEFDKYSSLFKNIFINEEQLITVEKIGYYKNNTDTLYVPSAVALSDGYTGNVFQREANNAGINALITGNLTSYGAYIYATVNVYSYPGGKHIGTVNEIGSMKELGFITESLSRQLVPVLTAAMKISINIKLLNKEIKNPQIFIDDVLQSNLSSSLVIDSGVHKIQIIADGYRNASTSYFFSGNEKFDIEVNMEKIENGSFSLNLLKPVEGSVYANGIKVIPDDNKVSKISINGNDVLGNFVTEDGVIDFYYIPNKTLSDKQSYYIDPRLTDTSEYIDKRRKIMYGAYSGFICSLIPLFFTNGNRINYGNMYNSGLGDYNTAKGWEIAWGVSTGISIAAGVFWGYELVRYLLAADQVLPQKAKVDKRIFTDNESKETENEKDSEFKK